MTQHPEPPTAASAAKAHAAAIRRIASHTDRPIRAAVLRHARRERRTAGIGG